MSFLLSQVPTDTQALTCKVHRVRALAHRVKGEQREGKGYKEAVVTAKHRSHART